jgi:hypothetical protein
LTPNEIGRQCWQPIDLIVGPAVFDFDVLALGVADFIQAWRNASIKYSAWSLGSFLAY